MPVVKLEKYGERVADWLLYFFGSKMKNWDSLSVALEERSGAKQTRKVPIDRIYRDQAARADILLSKWQIQFTSRI